MHLTPTSLTALPVEVQIEIASHLATTSERPMDDLRSLWVTSSSMRGICGDPAIGRRVVVDRCRRRVRLSNDRVNYFTILARMTQVGNLEACLLIGIQTVFVENHSPRPCLDYLTRAADGGHNMAAYLVAIFLYRHNGDAGDDDTIMRYIRWAEGKEESWATAIVDQRVGG